MKSKVLPKSVIILFFAIGVVSALCFRGLIIIHRYAAEYYRLVWYCGALGYLFFFGFRFYISFKRRRTIRKNKLINKLKKATLTQDDKDEIEYILQSLIKSKEVINYIIIFIMSIIAILADVLI